MQKYFVIFSTVSLLVLMFVALNAFATDGTSLEASFFSTIGNFFKKIATQLIIYVVRPYVPNFHLPIVASSPSETPEISISPSTVSSNSEEEIGTQSANTELPGKATASNSFSSTLTVSNPPTPNPEFTQGPEEQYLQPCDRGLKYFPVNLVSSVIGPVKSSYIAAPTSNNALKLNSYSCNFHIEYPPKGPGGLVTTGVVEYPTVSRAKEYIARQKTSSMISMALGDEGYYSNKLLNSYVRKGRHVFYLSWWCFCSTKQTLSQSQAKQILQYAVDQVAGTQSVLTPNPGLTPAQIIETGTEYLKRRFAGMPVTFYGDWPDPAPNQEIINLEMMINNGLAFIEKPKYKSLGIRIYVYEPSYWKSVSENYCPGKSLGCSKQDNIIHASAYNPGGLEYDEDNNYYALDKIIVHEATHKLYNQLVGVWAFLPVPHFFNPSFINEWATAFGTVNESTCKYLPIIDQTRWNNGDKFTPHCGFARAYGASEYLNGNLAKRYSEDVATFIEQLYFNSNFSSQGDVPTDPRYKQKDTILRKYGFL